MSNKTKFIIGVLFLVQIGVFGWSYWEDIQVEAEFRAKFSAYLENPKAVDSMVLGGLELDRLLVDMQQFENLTYLNLNNNKFKNIPTEVWDLPNLEVLEMRINNLKEVTFGENNTLKHLDLSINHIKNINHLGRLKSLEYIHLGSNEITKFPTISETSNIDTIIIYRNKLNTTHEVGQQIKKPISHINISNNSFHYFPFFILDSDRKIKKLDISNCGIRDFSIDGLFSNTLEDLNISRNSFTLSKDILDQFPNLKRLNISNMSINNLLLNHQSLEYLDIHDVVILGDNLKFNLPNLKVLHVNNWFLEVYLEDFNIEKIENIYIYDRDNLTNIKLFKENFPNAKIEIFDWAR